MDEDERQRKVEAGRAKKPSKSSSQSLASYRQKRAKDSSAGAPKKAAKGKSKDVPPPNDRTTQDGHVDSAPPSANGQELNSKHEVDEQPQKNKVKQRKEVESSPSTDCSPILVEGLKDEDLAALTGKEQLMRLQEAVEKRNEIISKLSANLQEAQSGRDQVQLEAQTLAGQIQDLQKQLHQTSKEFLRIKNLHGHSSDSDSNNKDALTECKNEGADSDKETTAVVKKLKLELENEKEKTQRLFTELQKERTVVLLLEEEKREWEEELKRHLMQFQDLQSQCLEMQQYKKEKESLNIEVLELRKRLQEEGNAEKRSVEEAACSARLVRSLEEELESIKKQLEDREKELKFREEEVLGLKASKNRQNQERAGFSSNETHPGDCGDGSLEVRSTEDSLNVSQAGDMLMERYLSSEPPAHSQSSLVHEDFQQCDQLDISGDCSFELNSEILGDHALLSISNRLEEVHEDVLSPECLLGLHAANPSYSQSLSQWLNSSHNDELDQSKSSTHSEDTHLEKDLLYQQCRELHEELAQKERDLEVLRDEVSKSAEELDEARGRWAQVTEELREALLALEEEQEKRIQLEELLHKSQGQDELQSEQSAFQEENGQEREEEEDCVLPEPVDLLMFSPQQSKGKADSAKRSQGMSEYQLKTLQDLSEDLKSELEDTKNELKTATELLNQRSLELENTLKDLQSSQTELLNIQNQMDKLLLELDQSKASLDQAVKEKSDLESRLVCLSQNVANLEETQVKAMEEKEEHKRKEEEMGERINKMEQVLEEELEQFENLLKSKDAEMAEEREKWEEEKQEKEKELSDVKSLLKEHQQRSEKELKELMEKQDQAVEEATEMVRKSYQQEMSELKKNHHQETSDLKAQFDNRLLELRFALEEEQKGQLNLIKQVTEREHERMMAELTSKHTEELDQLKTELTLELRESMEAAHQAEMQQVQAQKMLELEAIRLSLTNVHQSQLELSQDTVVGKIQASMKETFSQEGALIQAKHQMELDQIRRHHQEEQERRQQLHQSEMDNLQQQLDADLEKEKEKATKEMQSLMIQLEKASAAQSNLQTKLSEMEERLNRTQAELDSTLASLDQTNKDLTEAQAALSQAQVELHESQAKLEDHQSSSEQQNQKLAEELKQVLSERDAATRLLEELVSSHKAALQDKEQQVLLLQEKECELQQQILNLQKEKTLLKQNSQEEVGQLWTQLESMRTNRHELGELKEQLRARSAQVEDIERLKVEFNEQKREIKQQNETELESLRRYFEQRLQAAEEGYREEIALVQLRMIEGAMEESVLKTASDSEYSKCPSEEETDAYGKQEEMRHQLEETHTMELAELRASLSKSFKEELRQVRSDLTDQYYKELMEIKSRHALEMEQLKAKLSESHLRELTRLQLEAARHTEVEAEQRLWYLTEEQRNSSNIIHALESRLSALSNQHKADVQTTLKLKEDFAAELAHLEDALQKERKARDEMQGKLITLKEELQHKHESELGALRAEFGRERGHLEKALQEEKNKLQSLQAALDCDNSSELLKVRQRLEAQFENELQRTKRSMEEENKHKLQQAQEGFQKEKAALEHHLSHKYELSLADIKEKHKSKLAQEKSSAQMKHSQEMDALTARYTGQLDALSTSHRDQLAAMAAELHNKHNAELVALEARLHSQRKIDLASLEAAFQETSQAQLEAQEAELERKHQEEKDELERRMLSNMDTLEATYLKEVQTLRDEMKHMEERHCQELMGQKSEHEQIMERSLMEQQCLREELSKQLTDRMGAMAAQLIQAHKEELSSQKEALDSEHCQALEALKTQVLELEQQHSAALQELTNTYAAEIQQLTEQHQVQLQELKNISARELEACRRELEESSSRQRQHFNEEVELLKVQSEDRLKDKINQIKTQFEEQKEAELEKLRRSHTSEQEEKERSYTSKMSQLTAQLQQLDAVVAQLREEVDCLQGELEGKRSEMETLDTLLQRRERETQEGGNLLKMLTDDLQAAKEEKTTLLTANEKLRRVVVEMVRSTIATEELIGLKVCAHGTTPTQAKHRSSTGTKDGHETADLSSEDLELTHTLCESLLVSDTNLTPEGEEAALSAIGRLHRAVGTLLDLLNQANTQLEETHNVHLSLEQKFTRGRDDSAQLVEQHKLLIEQLNEEAKQKSRLQLDLHKAEGLLQGFVAEKAILEESLQQKEAQEERLAEELEGLKVKLHQMQNLNKELEILRCKNQELSEEHAILLRQKEHLSADLGEREKALLTEVEHLAQDRLDLQRQAEKDHSFLSQRIRALEREMEEQETKGLETELHHKTHTEDLHQRVQALEKQLKHNRQFIEEQAVEREHERDEFQQEIKNLETQLRQTPGNDNKVLKVENLQAIIKDKTEDHATLLATNQQFQHDLAERNEEIDKLAGRIRELEQALLNSAETNRTVSQLEQDLHKAMLREQELTQDKQALEQQQLANRLQISALQSTLDETKHCYLKNSHDPTQELREALDTAQQNLHSKEQEVEMLLGQLETVQSDLSIKEVELKHFTLQLELISTQNTAHVNELQEQIAVLKENVSALTILQEEREEEPEDKEADDTFPSALLLEKNLEIDQLHNEIHRLEQELEHSAENKDLEMEQLHSQVEDLRSQVEHLQSEAVRIRHDKQEEAERLHEVISTLQAELATLGPNLHEVSDSQDGDSINPSPAPSPEPQHHTIQEPEKKTTRPNNLKQELGVSYPASTHSLRSRLKALQCQLETAVAEKEGLERLLHTQEQEYRGHGEEFAKRLKLQGEKLEELQGLLTGKNCKLEQLQIQLEEQGERLKVAEEQANGYKTQAQNADVLHKEISQFRSLVKELQSKGEERLEEINTLKSKEVGMKLEMCALKESQIALERKIQEMEAEQVHMEALVAEERSKVKSMESATEKLTTQRDALRGREAELQQEIERLEREVLEMRGRVQELMEELRQKQTNQEEEQKGVLSHAEQTLAKADAVLKEKEVEHQTLSKELNTVKQNLKESTEKAEKLQREAQHKEQELADLENHNQQLKSELQTLQEDLAAQEEELDLYRRELHTLRLHYQHDVPLQQQTQKDSSHTQFEDVVSSHGDVSLSSPEVLRRLECSSERFPERLHTSMLETRLSELSEHLNTSALDLPPVKTSPRVLMEPAHSRTITPEPVSRSSHSPISGSNYSTMDSLDTDKVQELEGLDLTTPSSPLGSSSSLSAPEWASDGYGSNVSSDLGARLRAEVEQSARLDAQFVEYLRCRGINPTANTDSAAGSMSFSEELLSPELQALLRKVYQESCRILTLSQRRPLSSRPPGPDVKVLSPGQTLQRSVDGSSHHDESNPPMGWQQEKRALQETVIALRELLCRMAQRHNADGSGQLPDGHMELQLRAELEERQKEVQRAHNIQQEQKNKLQTLRATIEEGEDALQRERSKVQMLQQELEQERTRSLRKDIEDGERREAEHVSCEQQRSELMALQGQVEQEKVTCSNLRRELQIEQSRSVLLEKHVGDLKQELEEAHQQSAHLQEAFSQEKNRLEHLQNQAESHLAESRGKLVEAHRKLDEERSRSSKQLDELNQRHESDAARDRNFISDLHAQLDQERRRSEELASVVDRLRADLLQNRRKWEEEERALRDEMHREREAATRQKVAFESLDEMKQDMCREIEAEKSLSKRQGVEIIELKEKLHLMKSKQREREEQYEKERKRGKHEQAEREKRQQNTYSKLCELESLRQQDQQRLQELQSTLSELEREEREMARQRLAGSHHKVQTDGPKLPGHAQHSQQMSAVPPAVHMERLSKENAELKEQLSVQSQERVSLKQKISTLSQQLRHTENELLKAGSETENRLAHDPATHTKLQRLYERYLRAESYRKALVYQKRYLLLLIGGFQQCEQATLCLIATMGVRPSPHSSLPRHRTARFKVAAQVVIAVSRMKFLTRKWQKATRRVSSSGSVSGPVSGSKAEILRPQQPNFESDPFRPNVTTFVPSSKMSFRLHNRSQSSSTLASVQTGATPQDTERSLTEYIQHLEKVQHRLAGVRRGSPVLQPDPKKSER